MGRMPWEPTRPAGLHAKGRKGDEVNERQGAAEDAGRFMVGGALDAFAPERGGDAVGSVAVCGDEAIEEFGHERKAGDVPVKAQHPFVTGNGGKQLEDSFGADEMAIGRVVFDGAQRSGGGTIVHSVAGQCVPEVHPFTAKGAVAVEGESGARGFCGHVLRTSTGGSYRWVAIVIRFRSNGGNRFENLYDKGHQKRRHCRPRPLRKDLRGGRTSVCGGGDEPP